MKITCGNSDLDLLDLFPPCQIMIFLGDLHDLGDHKGGVRLGHGVSGCLEVVSKYSRIPNLVAI